MLLQMKPREAFNIKYYDNVTSLPTKYNIQWPNDNLSNRSLMNNYINGNEVE